MLVDVYYIHPKTKQEAIYQDKMVYENEAHVIYWYTEGDGDINYNRVSIFGLESDLTDEEFEELENNDESLEVEVTKITDRNTGKIIWPEPLSKYPTLDKAGFRIWS